MDLVIGVYTGLAGEGRGDGGPVDVADLQVVHFAAEDGGEGLGAVVGPVAPGKTKGRRHM